MGNPRLETPPKITIGVTEACPLRCRNCYADCAADPKSGELSAETWIELLEKLSDQGVIQAYFEGGEPLIKPGFDAIIRAASGSMMTLMRTHGWGLTAKVAATLADAGLGRVLVDLMGADPTTHESATGITGSFAQACDAVRHCVAAGIPSDILVVLTRQTAPQLAAIAHLAAELGAERLGVLRLYPLGRARQHWQQIAPGLSEQMEAVGSLQPPRGLRIMQSWHPNDHNCCWQAAAINAFGRAIGCMYLREYVDFGDATMVAYDEIFRTHPLYRQLRSGDVEETCATCSGSQGSHGGCRSTAYAWHGRWTAPGIRSTFPSTMASTSLSCRRSAPMAVRWLREPGVRLRPVPEQSCCLVYRRNPPALCGLNLTSWLVLTLCDGRSEEALTSAYREAVRRPGPATGQSGLTAALRQLEKLGLARRTEEEAP